MASTATVAGSIVFSSCFDSPRAALLFTTSSVRRREGTFLDHSSFHLAPFVRYRAIAPFGQLETSFLSIRDRKSTRLNSSHGYISYAVFCLKKKKKKNTLLLFSL